MKSNYIFELSKSTQKQHMLPVSPQNFDPLDKIRDESLQKKPIFAATAKPKALYESFFEIENPQIKAEDSIGDSELKRALAKEMKIQLEGLKTEILERFSNFLRDYRNNGRMSNEEVLEIKRQILYNKNKFEEVKDHVAHISQQYQEISSYFTKEIESLRALNGLSDQPRNESLPDSFISKHFTQKQLDNQFKTFKQSLIAEINNTFKAKSRSKLNEDVVEELRQIKILFESDLKQNFEMINSRVKRSEENLNDIMRKKRDYMDAIRNESLTSIEHQNTVLSQEIQYLEDIVKSKCEQAQAKALVSGEISKRMDLFRTEVDALRKATSSNHEEMKRTNVFVNRKLENLDYDAKRQFYEIQISYQKDITPLQKQDYMEKKLQKLNGDSEEYYKKIQQLKVQVEEITQVHKLLQSQTSTTSFQEIINRLEEKITRLQMHIEELELQVKIKQSLKIDELIDRSSMEKFSELKDLQMDQLRVLGIESDMKPNRLSHNPKEVEEIKDQTNKKPGSPHFEKNRFPEYSKNSVKYPGDPKVKSIIEEFHQKKRQRQVSSADLGQYVDQISKLLKQDQPLSLSVQQNGRVENGRSSSDKTPTRRVTDQQTSTNNHTPQNLAPTKNTVIEQNQADFYRFDPKKMKHAKILAQINYFINGTVSSLLDEDEETEIYCNLDDDGYIFDEENDFVLDEKGNKFKLTTEQIEKFNNNNMIE